MSFDNKVVWSEGMFLRAQHFQQYDRYVEKLVRGRSHSVRPHGWGLTELRVNRELLTAGKFALIQARGVLADGTPFVIPDDCAQPEPLELSEKTRNAVVYLALPVRQPGAPEIKIDADGETETRYHAGQYDAADANAGSDVTAAVQIARLRLKLMLETQELAGYVTLGVARVIEVRADKNVILDDKFIAPALTCAATGVLDGFVGEVLGLIHHRGEALAARVADPATSGAAEIADFLLLQAVNRYEPALAHLAKTAELHPEDLYRKFLEIAGELATFTARRKRPSTFPDYRHDDLQRTFAPLMADLRQSLSAVLEQTAIQLPLQERRHGIRVAPIQDRSLVTQASFVLAVKADMPAETLRRAFPSQVKVGPVEQIAQLVNVALPGITVRPLPVAPRQMPYHGGTTYFELDRSGPYWQGMQTSGGFAVHLAGDFPGIEMELWAIRESR